MSSYRQIDLSEWTLVGEGYNGQAFVSPAHPGVMLKLVRSEMGAESKVEQEFRASRTAYEMGLPVPQVYEIVRDGEDHGYLCQQIQGKRSMARLCADHPERIPELAGQMAQWGKALHRTPVKPNEEVPSMNTLLIKALETSPLLTHAQRERLEAITLSLPDTHTCLHGDFQPGNLILADDRYYWIDLGWLARGCYKMDLAHLYKMMVEDSVIPQVQDLTHMTREQMLQFWEAFAKAYTGTEDIEALNRELRPYAALDLVRTFHLHANNDPACLAFLKSRIAAQLSE
jgi:uncharacterized protein (TIGR02172 family)